MAVHPEEAAPVLRGVYPALPEQGGGHRQGQQQSQQPKELPGFGARGEAWHVISRPRRRPCRPEERRPEWM
ncbi:hypothetical protein GCM10018966_066460 [Streptomyces yanii]